MRKETLFREQQKAICSLSTEELDDLGGWQL